MKKFTIVFLVAVALPFLIACSTSGGSDAALNPYGFVAAAFTSANSTLPSNDIRSVVRPMSTGLMYAGTDTGVYSFNPSVATPVFTSMGVTAPANVNKMVTDGTAGDFYICANTGLFKCDAAGTFTSINAADFGGKKVLTFTRQSDSIFWVGLEDITASTNSIAKVDGGVATFYGSGQGNTASAVADIYVDTDIVMACGTGSAGKGGLFRYNLSGSNFIQQVVTTGLAEGASLFFKLGTTWYAGGPNSGLLYSTDSGGSWTATNLQSCSPVAFATESYNFAGSIRYWVSTDKAAYVTYDMSTFVAYNTANGLAGDSAKQIYAGSSVWVANNKISPTATTGGISRLVYDGN